MRENTYKIVCTINLHHSYYRDGLCKGMDLIPAYETRQLLADYRWLFKHTAHGGIIIFPAAPDGATPDIEVNKKITLTFSLELKSPNVCNVTDLPVKTAASEMYYFANGVNNNEITTKAIPNKANAFGLLQLTDTFSFSEPATYNFQLNAKSLPWKYIIVLEKDYTGYSFAITDAAPSGDSRYAPMQFIQTGGGTAYAKGDKLVFTSGTGEAPDFQTQYIPYYEAPKKQLQLIINNSNTGDTIIWNNLANPSVDYAKAEVYIYV